MIDLHDKTHIYQLIVGILGATFILGGCLMILTPFFPAILLAVIFTLSAWPVFSWLEGKLKNRPATAALLTTAMLAAGFIVPLLIIGGSLADNVNTLYGTAQQSLQGDARGHVSGALAAIPYVGDDLQSLWVRMVADKERVSALLAKYGPLATQGLLDVGKSIGRGLIDLSLGVLISYFFFLYGSKVAARTQALIKRFGGARGERLLVISRITLIGVVYGMTGTALLQGVVAAIGYAIADLPAAMLLGLLTFFVSFIPGGPALVWLPSALWLFNSGRTGMAIFLALWGALIVGSIDNLVRPYFVSRGVNLPFILVFLGLVGGVLTFGFIGLFIGPTLLALAYTLLMEWSSGEGEPGRN